MKKFMLLIAGLLFLCSCDFKISSPVNVSELFDSENKVVLTNLKFLLPMGQSEEETIQNIEKGLQERGIKARNLNKKETEDMSTFILFSMPVEIVKEGNEKTLDNGIYFTFSNNEFAIHTPDNMSDMLYYESMGSKKKVSILEFEILLTNDTDNDTYLKTYSTFVDSKPVFLNSFQISPYATMHISLSDVANQLLGKSSTTYTVFQLNENLEELKKQDNRNLLAQ